MSGKQPRSGAWAEAERAAPSAPPTTERYRCTERVAVGGMGVVWRARDTQLNRDVAYKSVTLQATEDTRVRLVQEARLAAQLGLTGVVQVFDYGVDRDGRPYYAMELLEFPLFTGDLPSDLRALASVAATVGQAHAQGIVHRDLKPSNLGRRGRDAVVADWGLARPFAEIEHWDRSVLANQRAHTRTGVGLGTAGYMAPEQLTGEGSDPRADVWSLAAILHELLTGEPPYNPDGTHRLLNAVVGGKLEVPPGPFGELARKSLALDPTLRHSDGTHFARELLASLTPPMSAHSRLPWLLGVAGLAAGLATAALWPQSSRSDLGDVAATALAEQGWLVYASGRTTDAHQLGLRARELKNTPLANGLLTIPTAPPPVALLDAPACDRLALDPYGGLLLCLKGERLSLRALDGTSRWERQVTDLAYMDVRHGITTLKDGWMLHIVREDGATTTKDQGVNAEEFALLAGEPILRSGSHIFNQDGRFRSDVRWLGPETEHGLMLHLRDDTLLRLNPDTTTTPGPLFDEPLVGWGVHGDRVTLVGLRGRVLVLDAATLSTIDTYLLGQANQVFAAAVSRDGQLAISSRSGVVYYDRQTPADQISSVPAHTLAFQDNGDLLLYTDQQLASWTRVPSTAHVGWSTEGSITALALRSAGQVLTGSESGTGYINPETLQGGMRALEHGPYRSLASTTQAAFLGAPGGHWNGPKKRWEPGYSIAAALGSDTLVMGKSRGSGLAWRTPEGETTLTDTPAFAELVAGSPSDHVLGRDVEGGVWRISADRKLTQLDLPPVTALASSSSGLWLARDASVQLQDGFTAHVGDRVTSLAAGQQHLAAGTLGGKIRIWAHDGTLLAILHAHEERVSALEFAGTTLLSGSWQPGLKRWTLDALPKP